MWADGLFIHGSPPLLLAFASPSSMSLLSEEPVLGVWFRILFVARWERIGMVKQASQPLAW